MKTFLTKLKTKEVIPKRTPIKKIIWSWLGAFIGIYLVALLQTLLKLEKDGIFLNLAT